ncbi:caspase family protein [Streptomyces sp. S07_1.15]|uniref:HD domain-containing protein n=1 Tax=Streptomyces sp. S07_1.15 TaxID=2873925 RepID=UPI001D14466C|nr:caspase family protein [Streptomyces sp. S07_1.15]MCC3654676.1 caspase family protein [Streptomyces sp. S07_1.15]
MTDSDSARETGRRRALLIGVRETRALHRDPGLAAAYPALDCVPQDIELMSAALKSSGYEVRSLHQDHPDPDCRDAGGNGIIGALGSFFASCEPGDTALVYLTCHGVTLDKRHYLVPADAQPGPAHDGLPSVNPRTLLQTAPGELLAGLSRAVTAVVCLDACREDGAVPFVHDDERKLSGDHGSVVWLYSCSPGEAAYADAEGSWFGRALAEALSASAAPKTIGEVYEYVRTVAGRAARDGTVPPQVDRQVPDWSWESARSAVVCDGSETTHRWTKAVEKSALWDVTADAGSVREPVLDRLRHLVRLVVGLRTDTLARRPDQWDDPRYPERLIGQLGELAVQAGLREDEQLSPPETAALLAAPIVHEGVVALVMDELGALPPEDAGRGAAGGPKPGGPDAHAELVRSELRDMGRAHHLVRRTAATLRERGQLAAARAADQWLRHRFVADWDLVWECTGQYPSAEKLFDVAVSAVLAATPAPGWCGPVAQSREEISSQLRQVLGHVSVRPGGSPRINDPDAPDGWNDHPPVQGTRWRGEQLATLLWAAALLAVDTRTLSSVLVDHLAARTPLSPSDAVISLSEGLRYDPGKRGGEKERHGVEVSFRCPHPALHAAVEELAARADTAFREIHRHHQGRAPLLRGLPRRVSTGLLKPRDRKYTEPLERFRLAEDEIRPLLMGTQLYGDPMLAVRELYQNALDACRYREMRVRYGRKRHSGHSDDWRPRIVFRQGVDEEGRAYIECEDNGSGMTREKLTSMFARAGRRYEQDPDFVQERRNWRRAGLDDVHLNSRFGIGVFSYFMLAEEVEVRTCPVDRFGEHIPQEQLRADIQSGSGLLQIRQEWNAPRLGGTRVRLYLAHHDGPRPSLLDTLESLLWFSDYDVTAVERAEAGRARSQERSVTWHARRLRPSRSWPGGPVHAHRDAWFVQGKGQLLLDGVVVRDAPAVSGSIVNLRERYEPVPSVDRNRLLSYDRDRVLRVLMGHAEAVAGAQGWKKVSLEWLWRLCETEPRLAVRLVDLLLPGAAGFVEPDARSHKPVSVSVPLAKAGVLPLDGQVVSSPWFHFLHEPDRPSENGLVLDWRRQSLGIDRGDLDLSFTGYPEPAGLDSLLFLNGLPAPDWAAAVRTSAAVEIPLAEAVRALRRYAIAGLHVPEAPDIRALRSVRPDRVVADVYECYREFLLPRPSYWGVPFPPQAGPPTQHAPLLLAAALSEVPLSRAAEALTQLSALDDRLPTPPPLGAAGARTISPSEATALAGFEASDAVGRLKPRNTRVRADEPRALEIPDASLDQIRALREDVGEAVVGPVSPTAAAVAELDALGPWLLSRDLDGSAPWLGADPDPWHVLRASQRLKLPVGEVVERIDRCSTITGIRGPRIPARSAGWRVPDWLQYALRPAPRVRGHRIGPWTLLSASWDASADPDEAEPLEETLSHLVEFGLLDAGEVQPTMDAVRAGHPPSKILVSHRSYSLVGQADLDGAGLTGAQFLSLAADFSLDLAGARALLLQEAQQYGLPLRAAELTGAAAALCPRAQDCQALCDEVEPTRFVERLTIGAIVQHALRSRLTVGASARRLAGFAGAGAPEPPGTLTRGEDPGLLDELTPIKPDQAVFDAGLLGPGTLGALELVLVSGRFGWPLVKTYERYAPFAELGLDVTVRAPEGAERGLVPDWRDVIVLTERLTGRAPALSGAVDPDHVLLCSEETDLSPARVLERLARYAGLFGLTLPDPPRTTGAP